MRHKRRIAGLLLAALLLAAAPQPALAHHPQLTLRLNGRDLFLSAPPVLRGGRVMVPLRPFAESLGGRAEWQPPGTVVATVGDKTLRFAADGPAYVPLQTLAQALGASIAETGDTVEIFTGGAGRLVVADGPLNVRALPSLTAPILTTVPHGTVLEVAERGTEWSRVILPGRPGWVATRYTEADRDPVLMAPFVPYLAGGYGYLEIDGNCFGPGPIMGGRLHVPLREAVERLGGEIAWLNGRAAAVYGGQNLVVIPGRPEADLNGQSVRIEPAPLLLGGRTLVPVRALADLLGIGVAWDAGRRTAMLGTGGGARVGSAPCNPQAPIGSYVVMDAATGLVLAEFRADEPLPIASTTKIMTALLAVERGNLAAPVTVSRNAAGTGGSTANLRTGEKLSLGDLVYGLMLPSGNDAAVAVAEALAGSEKAFVDWMNRRAVELGAHVTTYVNASGLDDEAAPLSSARDLALISRHALSNPAFRTVTSAPDHWLASSRGPRKLENKNQFVLTYQGATGVKNGWTELAGHTLVASAYRGGRELLVVVLGAPTRTELYRQATRLMDLGSLLHSGSWIVRTGVTR